MEIDKQADHLTLIPETEFEKQALTEMFHLGKRYEAYIKCGISLADVVGLRISTKEAEQIEIADD